MTAAVEAQEAKRRMPASKRKKIPLLVFLKKTSGKN